MKVIILQLEIKAMVLLRLVRRVYEDFTKKKIIKNVYVETIKHTVSYLKENYNFYNITFILLICLLIKLSIFTLV